MVAYQFLKDAGRIHNSGQARTLILTGNIHDLFCLSTHNGTEYVPLVNFLTTKWHVPNLILVVYELNGPIRFLSQEGFEKVRNAWLTWRTGLDGDKLAVETMLASGKVQAELESMSRTFDLNLKSAIGNPTVALELLRQMCLCSRTVLSEKPILQEDLLILIEAADMLIPEGEISRLSDADRHRVCICQDWFSDPGFMKSGDSVVLTVESRSLLNQRVARLPQIIEVTVPSPDEMTRRAFIAWFDGIQPTERKIRTWGSQKALARFTAGLSIHALMQLLKGACHEGRAITLQDVVTKVEQFIQSQLGDDIVEFKKPGHTLNDVIGFSKLKGFLKEELIPRIRSTGPEALPGAAVCGPIGGGKTFIFEALASELDMVVLVLKNIRSQWFGQTDVIFERLRRVLDALAKVLIFVDEADTQFGGVGPETHPTERRLTGKIQAMMTARIHLLSPDIRRPGRVGDLIIPVVDPDGADREEFLRWMIEPVIKDALSKAQMEKIAKKVSNYSAAGFASLRSELKAKAAAGGGSFTFPDIVKVIHDHIPPAIGDTRRYQTLQALVNCTRRSLLPDPSIGDRERLAWQTEIRELESRGVR